MILSCYPDYGKAPPEYIVNIIDVLSTFPPYALVKMCNLREGIPSTCKFLPTIADIVDLGNRIEYQAELERQEQEREIQIAEAKVVATKNNAEYLEKLKTARNKLVEIRVKHPYAELNRDLQIIPFKELEKLKRKPTPVEMRVNNILEDHEGWH